MFRFLTVIVTLLVTETFAQDFITYRLPNNTKPETYEISIRTWIDENNSTFTGSVRIGILATESTNFIRFHENVVELQRVAVSTADEVPITIDDVSSNRQYGFVTVVLGTNLTEGTRYFVDIDYVGSMNSFSGFYRSSYVVNDNFIFFASTHFEPTYARTAFPCYDEPQSKANFTIRITHVSSYSAISNMPVVSVTQNSDGSATTLFETTPAMSAYLVAFHVSDFPHITSTPAKPIQQRVFARPTAINATALALEAGELLLDALSDYVKIDFSLPKLDQISVPNFPSGAMENWGLATYAEYYTLYDESVDLYTRRIYATQTISHELAHQWFGNLVTPSWWTFLWMKEGFATFFEYLGVDLIYPNWQMMDYFVVENNQFVFRVDSNEFSQPMTHYVEHPIDIDFHFNSIAYNKAGAVIRMFWHIFGQETFMNGVTSYLRNNSFSDAEEEDLFDSIAASTLLDTEVVLPPDATVSDIMGSWSRQAGFPLIRVQRNYDDNINQVTLTQERYFSYPPLNPVNVTWFVPFNLATPSNPGFENTRVEGWIPNTPSIEITVNDLAADDYVLINKQAAGYYRVMYDERNYRLISDAILRNTSLFHSTNVAQLIDDANEFYETGRLSVSVILDVLRVLEVRSDFVSWGSAFDLIFFINRNIQGHRNYAVWADFIRSLTEELYDAVGIEEIPDEPILNKAARENIVQLACQMGSVHCRSDATRALRRNLERGEEFSQNIGSVLRCAAMRSASRTDFNTMWDTLKELPFDNFISRFEIIDMLGCSTSRSLLNEFVRSAYNLTIYSEFEQYSVVNSVLQNGGNLGISVTLEFIIENAEETVAVFGSWFIQNLAYYISNAEHIERFIVLQNMLLDADLLDEYEAEFNLFVIDQAVDWLNNQGETVNTWLEENFL